jgi:hypothetical protein
MPPPRRRGLTRCHRPTDRPPTSPNEPDLGPASTSNSLSPNEPERGVGLDRHPGIPRTNSKIGSWGRIGRSRHSPNEPGDASLFPRTNPAEVRGWSGASTFPGRTGKWGDWREFGVVIAFPERIVMNFGKLTRPHENGRARDTMGDIVSRPIFKATQARRSPPRTNPGESPGPAPDVAFPRTNPKIRRLGEMGWRSMAPRTNRASGRDSIGPSIDAGGSRAGGLSTDEPRPPRIGGRAVRATRTRSVGPPGFADGSTSALSRGEVCSRGPFALEYGLGILWRLGKNPPIDGSPPPGRR